MKTTKPGHIVLVALCDYAARYGKGVEFEGIVAAFEKEGDLPSNVVGIFRDRGAYAGRFKLFNAFPGGHILFKSIVLAEKLLGKLGIRLPARHIQDTLFDWAASRRIPRDCAILMTLPGMTRTLTRAKELGAQTVLHGVVMHPTYNRKLLARCYSNPSDYPAVWNDKMMAASERSMGLFDAVICSTVAAARGYVENGFSQEKVMVAPLGFERPKTMPEVTPWKREDRLKVLFVGNVTRMKGCDLIFQVAEMLDESRFEFHFCGDIQSDLEKEAAQLQQSRSNVVFHGYVPSWQIYSQCHVFVFMSLSEGWGKALLEAAFNGLLVVANEYSNADIVVNGQTGFICSQDASALAAALDKVERNRDEYIGMRKRLQQQCQALSWERFGRDVRSHLLRLSGQFRVDAGLVRESAGSSAVPLDY